MHLFSLNIFRYRHFNDGWLSIFSYRYFNDDLFRKQMRGIFVFLRARVLVCVCLLLLFFFFGIRGYPPLTVFAHLHLLTSLYSSYQTNYHCRFPRLFCLRSLYIKNNNFPALSKISTLWTLSNLTFRRSFLFLPFSVLLLLLWMLCFLLRATILIRSKFPFMTCCCNWCMHILVSADTRVCMHALRIVPVDKILLYINNSCIFLGMYYHTPSCTLNFLLFTGSVSETS